MDNENTQISPEDVQAFLSGKKSIVGEESNSDAEQPKVYENVKLGDKSKGFINSVSDESVFEEESPRSSDSNPDVDPVDDVELEADRFMASDAATVSNTVTWAMEESHLGNVSVNDQKLSYIKNLTHTKYG